MITVAQLELPVVGDVSNVLHDPHLCPVSQVAHAALIQSASEQTLERLCAVAADLINVPAAALVLHRNGVSRLIASSGVPERFRSYRWEFAKANDAADKRNIILDAGNRAAKQGVARCLGFSRAGFFMRAPVIVQSNYVLSLLLLDEKPGQKPTSRQLNLLDQVIALMRKLFEQETPVLMNTVTDVNVAHTLEDICQAISASTEAEALLDSGFNTLSASMPMAQLLHMSSDMLPGQNYRQLRFNGSEPIRIFCETALRTHIAPPDFEIMTGSAGIPRRIFQLSVSPLSPSGTQDYFLHFRVRETTEQSRLENLLALHARNGRPTRAKAEPTFSFLQETLVRRHSLRVRKDLTYLTLRTWRQSIRAYQIKALRALKQNVPPAVAAAVADEIAGEIQGLVGASVFKAVVPIPCGHTRDAPCLSVEIARALGVRLSLPAVQAFAAQPLPGTSHPKEIKRRPPMMLVRPVNEPALLIDDVATSGAHLAEASALLRPHCKSLLAIAWIGGDSP